MKKHYAVYKGDKFICEGTKEECAKYMDIKFKTIEFYTTKIYKERSKDWKDAIIVIKVEDID